MKTVLVNKPIHTVALERLREEVEVLTPFKASYDELMGLLPDARGVVLFSRGGPAKVTSLEAWEMAAANPW